MSPCNCGKSRPLGAAPAGPPPPPTPSQQAATANASRGTTRTTGQTEEFTLTVGDHTATFGSRLEAEAANVRAGRTGVVSPS